MAIAFSYFKEQKVDIAVVEAGLGGTTDATNVVVPLLSVITPISFDHMGVLGKSIESIALNKAGILKAGHPAVIAKQSNAKALQIILQDAAEKGISPVRADQEVLITETTHTFERQYFSVRFRNLERLSGWNGNYEVPLLGKHQAENATTALASFQKLESMGFEITPAQIKEGLKKVSWPCRFEVIGNDPRIVLDGAHNVESAMRLVETIDDYFSTKKIILVFNG